MQYGKAHNIFICGEQIFGTAFICFLDYIKGVYKFDYVLDSSRTTYGVFSCSCRSDSRRGFNCNNHSIIFFYYKIASQVIPRTEKNKTSVYIIKGFILQAASAVLFIVPTILFQLTDISGTVKLITWIIGGIVTLAAIPFVLHKFRYLNVEQYVKIFYGSVICAGIVGPSTGLLVCELMRLLAIMAL